MLPISPHFAKSMPISPHFAKICPFRILVLPLGDEEQQCICRDSELLVALILDCTAVELNLRETQREDFLFKFESVARGLCYALHCKRTRFLDELK